MSEIHVNAVNDISPEKVQNVLLLVTKLLGGLAKATKNTDVDDRIVEFLEGFVGEVWFAELLSSLINTFGSKKVTEAELKAHVAVFMASNSN